jgi:hypothetical protein
MAIFSPIRAFSKVLLPALGLPKIFTNPAFMVGYTYLKPP